MFAIVLANIDPFGPYDPTLGLPLLLPRNATITPHGIEVLDLDIAIFLDKCRVEIRPRNVITYLLDPVRDV